ncbi:MAG: toll/interleukin-1 receptor domain-containing protein [Limisphaerales bacterium]
MSWDVFIAYSRENGSVADRIETHLTHAGFRCYRDTHSIKDAAVWRAEIAHALRECSAVLAIVSDEASKSEYVSTELSFAQDFKKPIVPVLLCDDIANPELNFILKRFHWIKAQRNLPLLQIERAVKEAVERGRHPQVFTAIEEVARSANMSEEVEFASNSIGLEMHDCDRGLRRLVGLAFELSANADQYLGTLMQKCPRLADFDVELKIEKRGGPDNDWFGLEFGELWPAGYYQALLNGSGAVRIAKCDCYQHWGNLVQREELPFVSRGNGNNLLRVVRHHQAMHVLVNGQHALSCEDDAFRTHRLGLVASPGISTLYHRIYIKGWNIDRTFKEAFEALMQLDLLTARNKTKRIIERVPDYQHPTIDISCRRVLDEPMPDRNSGVLIIIGSSIMTQLHDGESANKLRSELQKHSKGNDPLQTAFVVTDKALIAEPRFQVCPWISVGGPESNEWTRKFADEFPPGKVDVDAVRVQERIADGDRRMLLWGYGREETVKAVEHFINGDGLARYLDLVWQRS